MGGEVTLRQTFLEYGIRINDLISGFGGGVVASMLVRNVKPFQGFATVLIGTITANYFTESAARQLGLGEGAAGFLVGLTAMFICQGLIEAARKWKPSIVGGSGDGK